MKKKTASIKRIKRVKTAAKVVLGSTMTVTLPPPPVVEEVKTATFEGLLHNRGGRLWFQVVATPELRAKVEMLKVKMGKRTLNDMAGALLDKAFKEFGL